MGKQQYVNSRLDKIAAVASLTAAMGSGSHADQSEYPQSFPPTSGSIDLCHNANPDETC